MKYKIGNKVVCQVGTRSSGRKYVFAKTLLKGDPIPKLEQKVFEIIAIDPVQESYMILVDDDMLGWNIGEWHIIYRNIDPKFKNKKFYELMEEFIIKAGK